MDFSAIHDLLTGLKEGGAVANVFILAALWSLDRRILKIEFRLGTRGERRRDRLPPNGKENDHA